MPPSLAGTARAAQLCGRCGHTRLRHTRLPGRPCSQSWPVRTQRDGQPSTITLTQCECPGFAPTKGH